jgi:hypothetical protein
MSTDSGIGYFPFVLSNKSQGLTQQGTMMEFFRENVSKASSYLRFEDHEPKSKRIKFH